MGDAHAAEAEEAVGGEAAQLEDVPEAWLDRKRRRGVTRDGRDVDAGQVREALAAWGVADVDGLIERGAAVQP